MSASSDENQVFGPGAWMAAKCCRGEASEGVLVAGAEQTGYEGRSRVIIDLSQPLVNAPR